MADRYITVAIHTYEHALALRTLLESEGIQVEFRNVNIEHPVVSSGIRVRIRETDLPHALRLIENRDIFAAAPAATLPNPAKPVIVPVDFSDKSMWAVITAFEMAQAHGTSVVLLHTYIDPYVAGNLQLTDSFSYEIGDENSREKIERTTETQMRHFSSRVRDMINEGQLPAVPFKTDVVEGVPEDAISEYARACSPFLIVMGTRDASRKMSEMIGSVTAEVLDRCRFSVLAIPETEGEAPGRKDFRNILFFSNLDQQDILAIDTLHRTIPGPGVKVTIATLPPKRRPFMRDSKVATDSLLSYCRQNFKGYDFESVAIGHDTAVDDVRRLVLQTPYDLIVTPNKKKNIFSRLFNPTLAHRILFVTKVPMLVIPV